MDQRISMVGLGVSSLERSRGFYEGLGWKASGASNDKVVFFQLGGIALGLTSREALAGEARLPVGGDGFGGIAFGGIALAHNCRAREEVDGVLALAETAGGKILRPALEQPWGGYSGYFADPDGHAWEVAWNPHFPIAEDGALELP